MWLPLLATAFAATDFSGDWTLDLAASTSLDPILEAEGVSWAERKAAAAIAVTQHITQDTNTVTVAIVSSLIDRKDTLLLDGSAQTATNRNGAPTVSRTRWDGAVLVTTVVTTTPAGNGNMIIRRSLEDAGATMRQHITLTKPDGTTYDVDRIFRRAK